jgi:hypothetical protein
MNVGTALEGGGGGGGTPPGSAWSTGSDAEQRARALKHYGACWYSVRVPGEVQREQFRCLTRSRLAVELKVGQKARVVALGLARWGGLKRLAAPLVAARPPAFGPIVYDFSMFAAGYRELRALWGERRAAELYGEMFLTTGDMEMSWLWPGPEAFAAGPEPLATFVAYWAAYLGAYRDLGVYEFEPPQPGPGGAVVTDVRADAFRELFERFGCPELGGLVPAMEARALDRLVAPLDHAARLEPAGPRGHRFVIEPRGRGAAQRALEGACTFPHSKRPPG